MLKTRIKVYDYAFCKLMINTITILIVDYNFFQFSIIAVCLNFLISLLQYWKCLYNKFFEINICLYRRHVKSLKKFLFEILLDVKSSNSIDWHSFSKWTYFLIDINWTKNLYFLMLNRIMLFLFDWSTTKW